MIDVITAAPAIQLVDGLVVVDGPGLIATISVEAAQALGENLIAAAAVARGHRSVDIGGPRLVPDSGG